MLSAGHGLALGYTCWALRSCRASPFVVSAACCGIIIVWWVVELNGNGDGGPPRIRLVHVVLLIPAAPSAASVDRFFPTRPTLLTASALAELKTFTLPSLF